MTDAELTALSVLIATETAQMTAENMQREAEGSSMAYTDMISPAFHKLQAELCRRDSLKLSRDDFFFPCPER